MTEPIHKRMLERLAGIEEHLRSINKWYSRRDRRNITNSFPYGTKEAPCSQC